MFLRHIHDEESNTVGEYTLVTIISLKYVLSIICRSSKHLNMVLIPRRFRTFNIFRKILLTAIPNLFRTPLYTIKLKINSKHCWVIWFIWILFNVNWHGLTWRVVQNKVFDLRLLVIRHVYKPDFAIYVLFSPDRKLGPVCHQIGVRARSSFLSGQWKEQQ